MVFLIDLNATLNIGTMVIEYCQRMKFKWNVHHFGSTHPFLLLGCMFLTPNHN